MDLTPVAIGLFKSIFIYIVPVMLILAFFKSRFFKGWIGEFIVNTLTWIVLDKQQYHLIKNVTLPVEDGTTQIDHVIVSRYGVFVIETKNMKGWIFGGEKQPTWTQKIYRHTNKFQNPLRQNYRHVKALENSLQIASEKLHSVVVFLGGATFKTPMPENVTYPLGYLKYIRSKREVVFSDKEVKNIKTKIERGRLSPTRETHRVHVESLKKRKAEVSASAVCPKCGSAMVLRTAKTGKNKGQKFWGCSNYPRCRKTMPVR